MTTAIVGCGNLLRKDDGLGPELIRRLMALNPALPVKLIDYGTAGFAFLDELERNEELIIVDAVSSGAAPGTIFRIEKEELELLMKKKEAYPDLHTFRWDDALSWGKWLLMEKFPKNIRVYLVEVKETGFGIGLSEPVNEAVEKLVDKFKKEFYRRTDLTPI
ncbi:hydrogenase maturation protease [Methylacidiphilum caldifontis]|uniref:Hydrogenase maturation protease n=1 Tax=Methylacidiphilum caldifontis TaxID=2795386 RepID=A0A4Y8PHH2_9BACT|nr:hydrogenase maturation protease [Methylacidiphilum caldifontis]QSR88542.1 hydrogenase maturation protease [Methylacidiphilum caldifontis]TFE72069.1 hydrogenase maturation protease [Methylacidiphilum caldifontis]